MMFNQKISTLPFYQWLLHQRENRLFLVWVGLVIAIQLSIFKVIYPFPNFMPPDSNSYLEAAWSNQLINMWAIGYSKFLRFVSSFTNSHFILVLLQYIFLQLSVIYLVFTIRYLLSPPKWVFVVLLFANILNPLVIHISNYVSSDALFTALSIVWFTQLIWILHKPTKYLMVVHALVLFFAFMVRYNALYYPFLSIIIITISQLAIKTRIKSIGLIILPLSLFIGSTEYEYYKQTGQAQYSAFGGWQIAANALYGYAHAKQKNVATVPARFRTLHSIVNRHMDSINQLRYRPDNEVAIYYLWDFKSPLKIYLKKVQQNDSANNYFRQWASIAPLYADYGRYLIKKYPSEFMQFYLWPNLLKYYAPPPKFMGIYNMGMDSVEQVTAGWFGWKNKYLPTFYKEKKIEIAEPFQIVSPIINVVFVVSYLAFILLLGFHKINSLSKRVLALAITIWFTNMFFSVIAAPIELRYQIFPIIFTFCFTLLLISFIVEECKLKESKSLRQEIMQNNLLENLKIKNL
ncbi:hypothetical protein [Niastella populi]|uniref:Glycosyltransferase RgtA/B/C/D-like domain-containing protein n=1 Tax=Niastella populi TaxID=550983 RepID=A0A1V9G7U9_9BACT|nr:hypothetical protein [Niastella populi]OQP66624.1 hypothetical protein A4R26_12620 [Niastella populi]